jgi:hypothetical protein
MPGVQRAEARPRSRLPALGGRHQVLFPQAQAAHAGISHPRKRPERPIRPALFGYPTNPPQRSGVPAERRKHEGISDGGSLPKAATLVVDGVALRYRLPAEQAFCVRTIFHARSRLAARGEPPPSHHRRSPVSICDSNETAFTHHASRIIGPCRRRGDEAVFKKC